MFRSLVALILGQNCDLGQNLRITKLDKQIKFKGIWAELEARNYLQRQSFRKCFR